MEDATIVATHMFLATENAEVDSCWINYFDPDVLAKELDIHGNEEIIMLMDIGYAVDGADLCKPQH